MVSVASGGSLAAPDEKQADVAGNPVRKVEDAGRDPSRSFLSLDVFAGAKVVTGRRKPVAET